MALSCALLISLIPKVCGQTGGSVGEAPRSDSSTPSGVYRSNAVIHVHSDLVLIPVTVTDHNGKTISGLEKQHFTVFEDSTRQDIIHFVAEDAPASIGIVFDASGSMRSKMPRAIEAVNNLLNHANPEDEFFFVRFSTEARLLVRARRTRSRIPHVLLPAALRPAPDEQAQQRSHPRRDLAHATTSKSDHLSIRASVWEHE